VTDPSSMGAYLRAARRSRRVSIERAAEETRIRPDFLMRMESDEFDFLAPTYVRGFLKSYARYLHADPQPLMTEFDARFGTGQVATSQIAALERQGRERFSLPGARISSWKLAAAITGGVLVLLALIGVLTAPEDKSPPVASASSSPSPSTEVSPSAEPSASISPSETPPNDGEIAFDDGIKLVILASKGDCWIRVTEDGEVVNEGLVPQGERMSFQATDRLEMLLGFPQGVELIVNGQNVGTPPGGSDPVTIVLPDDIDTIT
jgi:hypothetical protein